MNTIYFFHAALVFCALLIIYLAYDLQRKYPLPVLSHFFFYIIATCVYWFIAFILPGQLLQLFGGNNRISAPFIYWLFIFLSIPCALFVYYFFLSFFIQFLGKGYHPKSLIIILLPLIVLNIGEGIVLLFSIDKAGVQLFSNLHFISRSLGYVFRLGTIVFAYITSNKLMDKNKKRVIRIICQYYFTWFLCYYFIRMLIPSFDRILLGYVYPLFYLFSNVPPLIIIQRYIRSAFKKYELPNRKQLDFEWIFVRYDLTKREQEIFNLLLDGKSNKEIEGELFISSKTVRNHIYNIFKKMGVNNRANFALFIQKLANIS